MQPTTPRSEISLSTSPNTQTQLQRRIEEKLDYIEVKTQEVINFSRRMIALFKIALFLNGLISAICGAINVSDIMSERETHIVLTVFLWTNIVLLVVIAAVRPVIEKNKLVLGRYNQLYDKLITVSLKNIIKSEEVIAIFKQINEANAAEVDINDMIATGSSKRSSLRSSRSVPSNNTAGSSSVSTNVEFGEFKTLHIDVV